MTLLEAVNLVLRALSEHTVSSTEIRHPSVTRALDAINIARQELLAEQWWFNSYRITLVPNTSNNIVVSASMVDFIADTGVTLQQNGMLYDVENSTLIWTKSVSGHGTFDVAFEDLPGPAQRLVAYAAAITAYSDDVGGQYPANLSSGYTLAMQQLQAAHIRQNRYNARSRPAWGRYLRALRG